MSDPGSGGVLGGRLRAGLMESMTLYLVVIIGVLIVGYWSLEIVIEIELWVGGDGICWVCYLWGDLDFRCFGDRVECGFVLSWESLVLIWVGTPWGV